MGNRDWFSVCVYSFIGFVFALVLGIGIYLAAFELTHKCVRSHQQLVPQHSVYGSTGQYMGEYPAYYQTQCDAWEKR